MNPPLVSVIMSVYNAEKFLNSAIESITNQTFTDFEFIIIEDCSTDKTLEILKELKEKDNWIKIIQKEKNEGPKGFIKNLNVGLNMANAWIIANAPETIACAIFACLSCSKASRCIFSILSLFFVYEWST